MNKQMKQGVSRGNGWWLVIAAVVIAAMVIGYALNHFDRQIVQLATEARVFDGREQVMPTVKSNYQEKLKEVVDQESRPNFVPTIQNRQQFEETMKRSGAKYLAPGKGNQTINITLNVKGKGGK